MSIQFILFTISTVLITVKAHIRLTYPPARFPSLDFMDNARTKPPCGVPRPEEGKGGIGTTLLSGSQVQVTWQMAYPHQGGFILELLDESDQLLMSFTRNFTGAEDATQQSHIIRLPNGLQCENCVLRLRRQALEWGNTYQFWSCADVDIGRDPGALCSSRGLLIEGQCQCLAKFHGTQCQFNNECETDIDCGANGKCFDVDSVNYPRKACYCMMGFFGQRCEKKSRIAVTSIADGNYNERPLGNIGDTMQWRILQESNEIEIILTFNSSSWVSVGWKPKDKNLLDFSFLRLDKNLPLPSPSYSPQALPEPGDSHSQSNPSPEAEPVSQRFPGPEPSSEPEPEPEGNGDILHAMDGADIVIGSAKGIYHRIGDYYTISRATPEKDEFYGGVQSLTDASGFENNGQTVIMFRKKLTGGDIADHDISDQSMMVLWATGQTNGDYKHSPHSGLETSASATENFYEPDVLKYHGSRNRGTFTLNFMELAKDGTQNDVGASCTGNFNYPDGCRSGSCEYAVSWIASDKGIQFKLEAKMSANMWTGIGFSNKGVMSDADIILGQINEVGRVDVGDFTSFGYTAPRLDAQQDLLDLNAQFINGISTIQFTRSYGSVDNDDSSLDKCLYFLYPVSGGASINGSPRYHSQTPQISFSKICLAQCQQSLDFEPTNSIAESNEIPDLPSLPSISNLSGLPLPILPFLPELPRGTENRVPSGEAPLERDVTNPPVLKATTEDWRSKYEEFVDECLTDGSRMRTHWSGFRVGDCSASKDELKRCETQCMIWLPGKTFGTVITKECRKAESETEFRCFCQYLKQLDPSCLAQL